MTTSRPPAPPLSAAAAAPDAAITQGALDRNQAILARLDTQEIDLPARLLVQMAHLTCPATVWKYVESAATQERREPGHARSRGQHPQGRRREARRGARERHPRLQRARMGRRACGSSGRAGSRSTRDTRTSPSSWRRPASRLDGLIFPKVETPDEVRSIDATLTALETQAWLCPRGRSASRCSSRA